jgi:hypothetical protein
MADRRGHAAWDRHAAFAHWTYPIPHRRARPGREPTTRRCCPVWKYHRHLHTEEWSQLDFCNRLNPVFELWHRSGNWEMAHPWMEVILPWDKSREFIELVQSSLPPQALGPAGHVLVWPAHTAASDVPLFMHPPGDYVMGWGILPAVPPKFLDLALAQLDLASELSIAYGGKRYLSGYITFDTVEKWAAHFGDKWEMVKAAKKRYDPDGILGPGFIRYSNRRSGSSPPRSPPVANLLQHRRRRLLPGHLFELDGDGAVAGAFDRIGRESLEEVEQVVEGALNDIVTRSAAHGRWEVVSEAGSGDHPPGASDSAALGRGQLLFHVAPRSSRCAARLEPSRRR